MEWTIKYGINHLQIIFLGVLGILAFSITILLCTEYFYFKREAQKMLAVQEEYHSSLLAVNKVYDEYNRNKERLEQLEAMLDQKKKSDDAVIAVSTHDFPEGARVFSSDDDTDCDCDFVAVNRDLQYLKQSSLAYLKKHDLRYNVDVFGDYTQQLVEKNTPKKKPNKKRAAKKNAKTTRATTSYDNVPAELVPVEHQNDISFHWPIKRSEFWLSSFFGPRKKANGTQGFHKGIDMAAVKGTPVHPAAPGIVVEAGTKKGYGKTVVIAHNHKYKTRYAHLDSIAVRTGQKVTRTTLVGRVGSTGNVRSKFGKRGGSHLHFEVYAFGKQVNPMYFFG